MKIVSTMSGLTCWITLCYRFTANRYLKF